MLTAEQIIKHFELVPLPTEGGLFAQTYQSSEQIAHHCLPERYESSRLYGSAIYFMLTDEPDSFSALHKLTTDEIYHFYLGDPVELLQLAPDGSTQRIILGQDIINGQRVQHRVPRDVWQGSRLLPGGRWALMGTTMAPGYHDADYIHGERDALMSAYPPEAELIALLTRLKT